ncbi:hypothetical protein [Nocardia beijingensis]
MADTSPRPRVIAARQANRRKVRPHDPWLSQHLLLDSATEVFLRYYTPAPGDARAIAEYCVGRGPPSKWPRRGCCHRAGGRP